MTTATFDPWDEATKATVPPRRYWGRVSADAQAVVLVKGKGKEYFDEGRHDPKDRRVSIDLVVDPLDEMLMRNNIQRSLLTTAPEWTKYTWKSAQDLGITHARDLDGQWCRCLLVETGRTYTNRSGITVNATTVVFEAFFPTKSACIDDYMHFADEDEEVVHSGNGNGRTDERDTALAFLPALVKAAKGDPAQLAALLVATPMVKDYFTIQSPEVQALLKETA